jgi:hypothetical protein
LLLGNAENVDTGDAENGVADTGCVVGGRRKKEEERREEALSSESAACTVSGIEGQGT